MTLYAVVEWTPCDDSCLVGLFTSESGARAAFDAFVPRAHKYGLAYINEYAADIVYPLPKRIAESRIK